MSLENKDCHDLALVPIHIFRDPNLHLRLKGVAAVIFCLKDPNFTIRELAKALGMNEPMARAYLRELQYAGYGDIFKMPERCKAEK